MESQIIKDLIKETELSLERLEQEHRELLARFNQDRNAMLEVIKTLRLRCNKNNESEDPSNNNNKDMTDNPDIDLSGIIVDFSNAAKLEERVLLICKAAHMAGKLINVDRVGNYLIDHGQTQATVRNAKADVSRVIGNNRDYFQNLRRGTYQYLRFVDE